MAKTDNKRPKAFRTDRFRDLRLEAGYKFGTDLARAMNREQQQVNQWENGTTEPSSGNLVEISDFFTSELGQPISVDYLLGITNERGGRGIELTDDELIDLLIRRAQEGSVNIGAQFFARFAKRE